MRAMHIKMFEQKYKCLCMRVCMINENAILKTASVNDNPAADQIRSI